MAGPGVSPSGVTQLTQQLKAASTVGERNLGSAEELLSALDGLQEQLEQGFEELQSGIEELKGVAEQEGEAATTAIVELGNASTLVAEDRLPSASVSLGQALSAAGSSHDGDRDRLQEMAESLSRDGFEALAATLGAVGEEDSGSESSMSGAFTELDSSRSQAEESTRVAASETVEALDAAESAMSSALQAGVEAAGGEGAEALDAAATAGQQAAEQVDAGVRRSYDGWVASTQDARDAMYETVLNAIEGAVQALTQAQETRLDSPCDRLLNEVAVAAQAELETLYSDYDDWNAGSQELSNTATELERAGEAKDRFYQHIDNAG